MNNDNSLKLKIIAFAFLLAFSCIFVNVIYFYQNSVLEHMDSASFKAATSLRSDFLTLVAKFVTSLGGTAFLAGISAILLLWTKGRKNYGFAVVLPLGAVSILNTAFKQLIARSRPEIISHLVSESSYSFPSGHSACSVCFYLLAAYVTYELSKKQPHRVFRVFLKALCGLLTVLPFLIAATRIYLGVHYLSDVLAGIFLGLFFVFAAIGFLPYFQNFINFSTPEK